VSVFAISDLHLSLSSDKPMDVFYGWENYVERIEKNWRNLVKDTDTVILPGDISWAMKLEDTENDFSFIENLPGKKYFLKGNHDYWWSTAAKMNTFIQEKGFKTLGFIHNSCITIDNLVCCGTRGWLYDQHKMTADDEKILNREVGRLETSLKWADPGLEKVVFLHYPPVYGQFVCTPIIEVLHKYGVKRCYYGHIHGKSAHLAICGQREEITFTLVSCDFNGFRPVLIG